MKKLFKYALVTTIAFLFIACGDDDNGTTTTETDVTIAGFVAANPDYSSLLSALERAGLVATLDGTADFTVFAPNNTAFEAFLNANGFASLNDVPLDVLTNLLLNHVEAGGCGVVGEHAVAGEYALLGHDSGQDHDAGGLARDPCLTGVGARSQLDEVGVR